MFESISTDQKPVGIPAFGTQSRLALSADLQSGFSQEVPAQDRAFSIGVSRMPHLSSVCTAADEIAEVGPDARSFLVESLLNPQLNSLGDPPDADKLVSASLMLITLGQPDRAFELLSRLKTSQNYWVEHLKSVSLWKMGKTDESKALLRTLIAERTGDVRPVHALGRFLLLEENHEEAWTVLEQAARIEAAPEILNDAATAAIQIRKLREAIHFLRRALDGRSCYPLATNNLGVCAALQKRIRAAERFFKEAILGDNGCLPAVHNLAECLINQDRYTEASELLESHLERFRDDLQAKERLAWSYYRLGKVGRAIELLRNATNLMAADNGGMLNNLALFYGAKGDIRQAEAFFRRAIVADATNSVIRENLSEILRAEGRLHEAINFLPSAISARSARAALIAADVLHRTGAVGEAARRLEEYRATDPDEPRVASVLGYLLSSFLERSEEAIQLLQNALLKHPEESGVAANLVYALITAGRLPEARAAIIPWLDRAKVSEEPAFICISASWGLLQIREGGYEAGIESYRRALERSKNPLKARIQQKMLVEEGRHLLATGNTMDGERRLRDAIASKADAEFGKEAKHLLGSARHPN
jgi:Flp pilus assembly protein TadD